MKIGIDEQILRKSEIIEGDFKKLKNDKNADLSKVISTMQNAIYHIEDILKNISYEITKIQKKIKDLPEDIIL